MKYFWLTCKTICQTKCKAILSVVIAVCLPAGSSGSKQCLEKRPSLLCKNFHSTKS